MVEIEVKILDVEIDVVRKTLENLGAGPGQRRLLRTTIYDFPDRRLLSIGGYVRIRTDNNSVELTCKTPLESARHKCMREVELPVHDPQLAHEFLEVLGLEKILLTERYRTSWTIDQLRFDLDEWPVLPPYLEIEGPTHEEVDAGLRLLGLPPERGVAMGPREVFAHYGLDLESMDEIRFSPG